MKKFRITLISDLHVGSEARGLDLCPHELTDEEKVARTEDFVHAFEIWAASQIVDAEDANLLCITGDISNRAHADEFIYADRAIKRIAKALHVREDSIFFVPGNHDVNWPVMTLAPTSFWSRHRYAPLFQENLTFKQRALNAVHGNLERDPYFVVWSHPDAIVIGINSAAYDSPTTEPHNGIIKQETVDAIDQYLRTLESDSRVKICLLHHHVDQYSENIPNSADLSIAVNAENLVRTLTRHRVDLLLHGHKHYPRLGTKQPDNHHPFISICAGSFSAILPPLHYEGVPNLFHVINIKGRENDTARIFGCVDTWSLQKGKWKAGNGISGMYAQEAFGSFATPSEIQNLIRSTMQSQFGESQLCRWADLVEKQPNLGNIRTDVAYDSFELVSNELGYEVAGDRQVADKKWIAYRRQA